MHAGRHSTFLKFFEYFHPNDDFSKNLSTCSYHSFVILLIFPVSKYCQVAYSLSMQFIYSKEFNSYFQGTDNRKNLNWFHFLMDVLSNSILLISKIRHIVTKTIVKPTFFSSFNHKINFLITKCWWNLLLEFRK